MNKTLHCRRSTHLLVAVAFLASCGGGVGSGGTGRSDFGLAAGTVNGFGSVIVDGVGYDDRNATVVSEIAPGADAIAEVRLGHRVSVEYETPGVAQVIHVDAAVSGPVASIGAGAIVVLGQTIVVNTNGSAGPITAFGGYALASDVRVGDPIDVHGLIVRRGSSYVIQATRIDKLAAAPAFLRVSGVVAALSSSGARSFALASLKVDASVATVVPGATMLADGQTVTLLARSTSMSTPAGGGIQVQAAQVRVRALPQSFLDTYLSGAVSQLDALARTFVIDGHAVSYAAATILPAPTSLLNGVYVQARGMTGADGTLQAASVAVRDAGSDSEAELHGNISALDATGATFTVRDVKVDAAGASLRGCPATGLANGLFVEVHGATISTGVRALTIQCEGESSGSTVEREGKASAVDLVARTFVLTPEGRSPITVSWTDTTFFGGVTPATLAGRSVEVQGSLIGGGVAAMKVKLDD